MLSAGCFPRICREHVGFYGREPAKRISNPLQQDRVLQKGLVYDFDCKPDELCKEKYTTTTASAHNGILQSRATVSADERARRVQKSAQRGSINLCDGEKREPPSLFSQDTNYRYAFTHRPAPLSKPFSYESGHWHEMVPSCMIEPTMCINGTENKSNFKSGLFNSVEQEPATYKKVNMSQCNTNQPPTVRPKVRHSGVVFGTDNLSFDTETHDSYRHLLSDEKSSCEKNNLKENLTETNRQTRTSYEKGSIFRPGDYNDIGVNENDCVPASMHTVDYGKRLISDRNCGKGIPGSFLTRSMVDATRTIPSAVDGSPMEVSEQTHPKIPILLSRSLAESKEKGQAKITAHAQRTTGKGVTFGYVDQHANTTYGSDFNKPMKAGLTHAYKPASDNNLFWSDATFGTGKSTASDQNSSNLLQILHATDLQSNAPIDRHTKDNIGGQPESDIGIGMTETQHEYEAASRNAIQRCQKITPDSTEFNFIRNYVVEDPAAVHIPESKATYKDTMTRGDRLSDLHASIARTARAVAHDAENTHIHGHDDEARSFNSETSDQYTAPPSGLRRTVTVDVKTSLRSSPFMPMTRNLERIDTSTPDFVEEKPKSKLASICGGAPNSNLLLNLAERPKPVISMDTTVPERYFQMDKSSANNWQTNYKHYFDKPGLRSCDTILLPTRPKQEGTSQNTVLCPPYRSVIC